MSVKKCSQVKKAQPGPLHKDRERRPHGRKDVLRVCYPDSCIGICSMHLIHATIYCQEMFASEESAARTIAQGSGTPTTREEGCLACLLPRFVHWQLQYALDTCNYISAAAQTSFPSPPSARLPSPISFACSQSCIVPPILQTQDIRLG